MATNKGGRPKAVIDWEEFDKLCEMQCTLVEIANWMGCSERTVERRVKEEKGERFVDYFKKASSGGKRSLRRWQFETAEKGNVGMQIWLGKQYLGQTEKVEETRIKKKISAEPMDPKKWLESCGGEEGEG